MNQTIGKAFSVLDLDNLKDCEKEPGIDLRDHFAAFALLGLMISGEPEDVLHNAIVAYRNADAMLEQRKKCKK